VPPEEEEEMQVETILQSKGRSVHTVASTTTIADAVAMLNSRHIGATVVVDNGRVVGIVSERDVVRHLGDDWSALSSRPVSDVMTRDVVTVGRYATIDEVMEAMTQRRIRHLPVVEGGDLIGIVSIGDVVKRKIEATEQEALALKQYISS
jgi:CBS domain-containing protein